MKDDTASSTAFTVVQGIMHTARMPMTKDLVPNDLAEACRHILSASPEGRRRLKQLDSSFVSFIAPIVERLMLPGITLHYVLRKRFIEDAVVAALADGATQVVNLGAGFDMLAWRLHQRYPEVTFVEIDHPATSATKSEAVGKTGDNVHFLAVDLSEKSVESVLNDFAAFDVTRKTVYVCEGVLMYLDQAAVESLFAALKNLTGKGSRFVFTAIAPTGSANNNFGLLLRFYLTFKAEPLNWSLESADLNSFVQKQGYQLIEQANDSELLQRYVSTPYTGMIHKGEYLGVGVAK